MVRSTAVALSTCLFGCANLEVTQPAEEGTTETGSEEGPCGALDSVPCEWALGLKRTLPIELAVGSCGSFYVAYASAFDYDEEVERENEVRKYDAEQNELWSHGFGDAEVVAIQATGPDQGGNQLVAALRSGEAYQLVALDDAGEVLWNYALPDRLEDLAAGPEGRVAAIGSEDACDCGYVMVLDAAGEVVWTYQTNTPQIGRGADFGPDGDLIVGGTSGGSGFVARLDPGGALRWEQILDGSVLAVAADDPDAIYAAIVSSLRGLSATGDAEWSKSIAPDAGLANLVDIDLAPSGVQLLVVSQQSGPFEPPLYYYGVAAPEDGATEWEELVDGAPLEIVVDAGDRVYILADAGLKGTSVSCRPG